MSTLTKDDRRLLGDSIERFAAQEYEFGKRHAILSDEDGYSKFVWRNLAELQLLGLGLPEKVGGIGGSLLDLGVVMGVIGRYLLMEPYLSTAIVVAPLLAEIDPQSPHINFEAIIAGERILALAHFEPALGFARGPISTRATKTQSGYRLNGAKMFILDGPVADMLLVSALAPGGEIGLFWVEKEDVVASMRIFQSVDQRWVSDIVLVNIPAQRIGGAADAVLDAALDRAVIAIGFEAVSSMQVLIDDTAAYIKQRRAFGKTLSQLQVLQHRIVDMVVLLQEAQAIVEAAAIAADSRASERAVLTAAAKTHVCRAARFIAENAVQLHGGIAMTDELRVSHHFKRLMMIEALFGNADYYLDRYVELAGCLRTAQR